RTIYGNGQEFTEEGIIKFYAEELGGQDHALKKYVKISNNQNLSELEVILGLSLILSGIRLLALGIGII
ncbi:26112_t:CDS:1, partial [Gigaspora rosea]